MKIYFLGTGTSQGIPVIGIDHPVCKSENCKDKRLRTSVWIEHEDTSIVIDCGPDFRQQMLTSGCNKIDGVLFTHEHADHTAGLDDLRPITFIQGNVDLFGDVRVVKSLKKRFDYAFKTKNRYPGTPQVTLHKISSRSKFNIKNTEITPIKVMHGNLPILGYRIGNFAYLTDAKTIDDKACKKLQNLDVLVINALRIQEHFTHFNLEEALNFIQKINPKKTYLTHISYNLGFHNEVEKNLPENVFLAYDNLTLTL